MTAFFARELATPNDVTLAGEKLDIFSPPADGLRSDAVVSQNIGNRPMMSLSPVKGLTFSSLLGTACGATPFLTRKLATLSDVTVAGEKFDIFIPPGDCLRSDAVVSQKVGNRPMTSLSQVKSLTFSSLLGTA